MGFKQALQRIGEHLREKRNIKRELIEEIRIHQQAEDSFKSANERELERFNHEDREELIKQQLEIARKNREQDIRFHHNPLDTPNIMKAEWEVLKERNQFAGNNCIFSNSENIFVRKRKSK